MRTPWSKLLDYGVGFAAFVVMCIGAFITLSVIGIAVLISKLVVFVK